jgi:hypothetical protein
VPALAPIAVGVEGAAALLALPATSIKGLVAIDAIPSYKVGKRRLFDVAALVAWSAARTAETAHLFERGRQAAALIDVEVRARAGRRVA